MKNKKTQPVSEIINLTRQQIGRSKPHVSCSVDRESTAKAAKVFMMMALTFGRKWEAQYGVVEGEVFWFWAKALRDYSMKQVEIGIEKSLKIAQKIANLGEVPFPPDLFCFKSYCREPVVHPMNRLYISPPNLDRLRDAGLLKLKKMREEFKI